MGKIKIVCPKCDYLIDEFTEEELKTNPSKEKRRKYYLKTETLCPNCLANVPKLKEVRE